MDSTGAPAALGAPDAAMVVIGGGGVHGPGGGGPLSGVYPQPQATHAQVLADRALFMRLLPQLYAQVGEAAPSGGKYAWVAPSKPFRVPVVCGKDLDLHMLYSRVTAHGGLEYVVAYRKWTDVLAPFNFPPSFTSKSFTVRKIYSQFLHHFEQVYFHRKGGLPLTEAPTPPPQQGGGARHSAADASPDAGQSDQHARWDSTPPAKRARQSEPPRRASGSPSPAADAAAAAAAAGSLLYSVDRVGFGGGAAAAARATPGATPGVTPGATPLSFSEPPSDDMEGPGDAAASAAVAAAVAAAAVAAAAEAGAAPAGGGDLDAAAAHTLHMLLADGSKPTATPSAGLPPLPPGAAAAAAAFSAAAAGATDGFAAGDRDAAADGASPLAAAVAPAVAPDQPPAAVAFAAHPMSDHGVRDLTGMTIEGTVDGRFDVGYFVSLNVGGSQFRGMLYCPMAAAAGGGAAAPLAPTVLHGTPGAAPGGGAVYAAAGSAGGRARSSTVFDLHSHHPLPAARASSAGGGVFASAGRRRKVDKPKASKTAFNFFAAAHWQRAKSQVGPGCTSQDVSRLVGEWWARTAAAEREPFVSQAAADKQRYLGEKRRFERRMSGRESASSGEEGGRGRIEQLEGRAGAEGDEGDEAVAGLAAAAQLARRGGAFGTEDESGAPDGSEDGGGGGGGGTRGASVEPSSAPEGALLAVQLQQLQHRVAPAPRGGRGGPRGRGRGRGGRGRGRAALARLQQQDAETSEEDVEGVPMESNDTGGEEEEEGEEVEGGSEEDSESGGDVGMGEQEEEDERSSQPMQQPQPQQKPRWRRKRGVERAAAAPVAAPPPLPLGAALLPLDALQALGQGAPIPLALPPGSAPLQQLFLQPGAANLDVSGLQQQQMQLLTSMGLPALPGLPAFGATPLPLAALTAAGAGAASGGAGGGGPGEGAVSHPPTAVGGLPNPPDQQADESFEAMVAVAMGGLGGAGGEVGEGADLAAVGSGGGRMRLGRVRALVPFVYHCECRLSDEVRCMYV